MRIISKFQDYYDSALAFGHDEHVVFERKETEYLMNSPRSMFSGTKPLSYPKEYEFMKPDLRPRGASNYLRHKYDTNRKGFEFTFYPITVAFCGKIYCGIEIKYRKDGYMGEWSSNFAYDYKSYTTLLLKYGLGFTEKKNTRRWSWESDSRGSPLCAEDVDKYFSRVGEDRTSFFADKGKPIAICKREEDSSGNHKIRFNAALSSVAFYKVFDPYTAFQELDMFISGVMTRDGNPMAGISDIDLRDKHGFDKMSFKKAPTKKR